MNKTRNKFKTYGHLDSKSSPVVLVLPWEMQFQSRESQFQRQVYPWTLKKREKGKRILGVCCFSEIHLFSCRFATDTDLLQSSTLLSFSGKEKNSINQNPWLCVNCIAFEFSSKEMKKKISDFPKSDFSRFFGRGWGKKYIFINWLS